MQFQGLLSCRRSNLCSLMVMPCHAGHSSHAGRNRCSYNSSVPEHLHQVYLAYGSSPSLVIGLGSLGIGIGRLGYW